VSKMKWNRSLMLIAMLAMISAASFGGVFVSVGFAPPPLRVYVQPPCPGDGYLWTPGYWAYGPAGYYWVPGAWVLPPSVGVLWTPGYWGFAGGVYAWHAGYWGPHVGFYGGVNYGFGYAGVGFSGGMWVGGHFRYNTAVANVNTSIVHNTYVNRTVINNTNINRASFNGPGGVNARPNSAEMAASRESHVEATSHQLARENAAQSRFNARAEHGNAQAPHARPANRSNGGSRGTGRRG
jgi:WXXGXW repeat (2 copies)